MGIAQISVPIGMILAGRLADVLFEPIMASGNLFARTFTPLVGTGPGSVMAVMFVFAGILGAMVALSGYLFPAVRNVEELLPDYDATASVRTRAEEPVV